MLYQLIYHSHANPDITSDDINSIREAAKTNNVDNGIKGCLLYHNKQFLQMLEGEEEAVLRLFNKIAEDGRHSQVTVLLEAPITEILFKKSPMAFDVVDKDDFAIIGAEGSENLEFIKNDIESGKKLFNHIEYLIDHPVDRMHETPFGPSA